MSFLGCFGFLICWVHLDFGSGVWVCGVGVYAGFTCWVVGILPVLGRLP